MREQLLQIVASIAGTARDAGVIVVDAQHRLVLARGDTLTTRGPLSAQGEGVPLDGLFSQVTYRQLVPAVDTALAGCTASVLVHATNGRSYAATVCPFGAAEDRLAVIVWTVQATVSATEEELDRRLTQQSAIAELGALALQNADDDSVIRRAADLITTGLGIEMSSIVQSLGGSRMRVRAARGWGDDLPAEFDMSSWEDPTLREAFETGPLVIQNLPARPEFHADVMRANGVVSCVILMIGPSSAPFGLVGACTRDIHVFSPHDLNFLRAIGNVVAAAVAMRQGEERLRHEALHDPLTGLPNRALLQDRLATALARSGRTDGPMALFTVDVDRLGRINDQAGHHAGDALLRALGPRLHSVLRPSDTVGRYSGDAFTVICDEVESPEGAYVIAERLMEALEPPFDLPGGPRTITCSIGVVVVETGAGRDPAQLLADAEDAMVRAQTRGHNRVEVFDSEIRRRALDLGALEDDLRRALADPGEELWVAYQPLHELATGDVVGAEALARWQHPLRGPVGPDEFIPVAEESGQIVTLGEQVLHTACADLVRLRRLPGRERLFVSVNASVAQVTGGEFHHTVAAALAEHGLSGDALAIEITEGMLLDRSPVVMESLRALRELGVGVSVDDFGTGYSSLSYLRRYPVSTLKIDRSFVADLQEDGDGDAAIVEAIVGMARALGLQTIPEGVETQGQLERLRALGCDVAQGFLLNRPQPVADLEAAWRA